jgi:double-stranded uracil-DNA glycosylase
MDRRTIEIYEHGAGEYGERRRAYHHERAAAFAAALPAASTRLDLGCGPGHYLPHLGRPVVAADAAVAMVVEARRRHPATPGVACDVEALPVRRGGLAGVWTSKCLQHVPADRLPMALAQLHRALRVDGLLDISVFDAADPADASTAGASGDGRGGRQFVTGSEDDFPGRLFTLWSPGDLRGVLVGAGFTVDEVAVAGSAGRMVQVVARARRARTLPDTVGAGMRLLVCGLNPSLYAADAGVGFARPGNRFWPAALAAGIVSVDRDPDHALRHHGVGMTDVVKRATVAADALRADEYRTGLGRVERLVAWLRPTAICFVGLAGWRATVDRHASPGVQPGDLAGAPVYVMPSTSGLNARTSLAEHADHLHHAARLAGATA